ncbi:MAG: ABC transporter substrate-binding protein [Acidimicrobiia bacterium]
MTAGWTLIATAVLALVAVGCGDTEPAGTGTTTSSWDLTGAVTTASASVTSTSVSPVTTTSSSSLATTSTTEAPPPSTRPGEVRIGLEMWPSTLNPFSAIPGADSFATSVVGQAWLPRVYEIDPHTLEFIPDLVTEIPSPANGRVVAGGDSVIVTWTVHDEAVWSDGMSITGADLAFTLEAEAQPAEYCDSFEGDAVTGAGTVLSFEGKSMTARFGPPAIRYETALEFVLPRHALEGKDLCAELGFDGAIPSGGPFMLAVAEDRSLRFVRNSRYWRRDAGGAPLPLLDAVEFVFVPEVETAVGKVIGGELDVYDVPAFGRPLDRLDAAGVSVDVTGGPIWEHFNFQFGPNNPNEDTLVSNVDFRRAIAHAVDRTKLAEHVGWLPIESFFETFAPAAASPVWGDYDHDPVRARELVGLACERAERDCVADPPLVIFSSTQNADERPAVARMLVDQLAAVGIDLQLELQDSQLFFGATLDNGAWDMGEWAWVGSPGAAAVVSILDIFDPDGPPPDGSNFYRWGTPGSAVADDSSVSEVRALQGEIRSTTDPARVFELARAIDDVLADQVVILPFAARRTAVAFREDVVRGVVVHPSTTAFTWNIETWRPAAG